VTSIAETRSGKAHVCSLISRCKTLPKVPIAVKVISPIHSKPLQGIVGFRDLLKKRHGLPQEDFFA